MPDKTEVKTFCPLSRKQAALYQQAVADLADQIETAEDQAKGHCPGRPDAVEADLQSSIAVAWRRGLGGGGQRQKFARLRDIAEVVAARRKP